MISLTINLDGEGAFADVPRDKFVEGTLHRVAALGDGMTSGKPSVAFLIALPDGRQVFGETSLAMLLTVADAFRARYGDPRQDDQPKGSV